MCKVLFLGDLHIGARNNSRIFLNYFKEYFEKELFPYILENNIQHVVQLGDILDRRKSVDFSISNFLLNDFFSFFETNQIHFYSIIGNHDMYYKEITEISGIKQFAENKKYIQIFDDINVIEFSDKNKNIFCSISMIPWICNSNKNKIEEYIKNYKNNENCISILAGHFELSGFPMIKNILSEHDCIDKSSLNNFNYVFSGHYHTPSSNNNITYIGTPYQITWSDHGDKKRFLVYDTIRKEFDEINTKSEMFHKILYHDNIFVDFDKLKNSYIKIIINEKIKSNAKFDLFISNLEKFSEPSQIQIIDNTNVDDENNEIFNIEIDDPISILIKSVETYCNTQDEQDLTKELLLDIHKRTLENIHK